MPNTSRTAFSYNPSYCCGRLCSLRPMESIPLAHGAGGHWLLDLGIYLGPFLTIIGVVLFTDRRRRKREEAEEAAGQAPEEPAGESA